MKRLLPLYSGKFFLSFVLWYSTEKLFIRSIGTYQAHYLCDTFISSYANPIDQADNFH